MVLSENLAEIIVQLAPKTREVAQQFQAELNQLQLLVGRLRKDVDARALDKRKFEKELEDGLRNIAALSQREQELIKRYERDRERAATLDDVRSRKRERLEKHTLSKHVHSHTAENGTSRIEAVPEPFRKMGWIAGGTGTWWLQALPNSAGSTATTSLLQPSSEA